MTTITAKELRDNLGAIGQRVSMGEHINVTYREKPMFILIPPAGARLKNSFGEKLPGLAAFDKAPKRPSSFDPNKSFKELYHEHLDEKYGVH